MGVSNVRPMNYAIDFPYATRVDESDGTGAIVYHGIAVPGTLDAEAKWAIKRISVNTTTGITKIEWASGHDGFSHVWNARATASYS